MRLTFNRLLDVESIQPDRVQLVRHQDARAGAATSPYALWVDRDPGFELYQSTQARPVFRVDEGSLIASFVVTPAAETVHRGGDRDLGYIRTRCPAIASEALCYNLR